MTSENWAERRGKKPLEAQQISARVGDLLYTPRGESLTLADPAVLYLEGAIAVLRGIGRKMAEHVNHLGQPIGFPLPAWTARPRPPRTAMEGRFCVVEPVDPARHAADLHAAYLLDKEGRNWTYLPHGPYARFEDYRARLEHDCLDDDRLIHAIVERRSGHAVGVASLMRIDPAAGVIEVGGINYAPPLQRTPAATANGRRSRQPSSAGSTPAISMRRGVSSRACRACDRALPLRGFLPQGRLDRLRRPRPSLKL